MAFGNEVEILRPELRAMADAHVCIPMLGQMESLYVAHGGRDCNVRIAAEVAQHPHSKIANTAILEWGTLGPFRPRTVPPSGA